MIFWIWFISWMTVGYFFYDIFADPITHKIHWRTEVVLFLLGPITWLFIGLIYLICFVITPFVKPAKDWAKE